jgi:hypothetical protein
MACEGKKYKQTGLKRKHLTTTINTEVWRKNIKHEEKLTKKQPMTALKMN